MVSDSKRFWFFQELTPTLKLGLSLWLALASGHFEDKKFFIHTTFKDFFLDVYDDIDFLHLVTDSQRFLFSHKLNPTLTLGLSLGLALAWGHFEDKKFLTCTFFKGFSLDVYGDIDVLHLVSDSQRSLFFQELTPTLTLELRLGFGLA